MNQPRLYIELTCSIADFLHERGKQSSAGIKSVNSIFKGQNLGQVEIFIDESDKRLHIVTDIDVSNRLDQLIKETNFPKEEIDGSIIFLLLNKQLKAELNTDGFVLRNNNIVLPIYGETIGSGGKNINYYLISELIREWVLLVPELTSSTYIQ